MKSHEQVLADLDAKIPASAVSERSQAGVVLSYLEGHYVIDRMNKVFGQGNWQYKLVSLQKVFEGTVGTADKARYCTSYVASVSLSARYPDGSTTEFLDVGYGDGSDKTNPGKAHELAVKESVTDGLKRCAKNLGMSMGLALYDKEQTNVEDDSKPAKKQAESSVGAAVQKSPAKKEVKDDRTKSIEEIRNTVLVLEAKKKLTRDAFVAYIKETYGAPTTDALNVDNAKKVLQYVRGLL